MKKDLDLEIGDLVVYPSYGVGEIEKFDKYDIDGLDQDFILINFKQDKMKLRIPRDKASSSGLRKLSNKNRLSKALDVLGEKPAVKKDMWIKRAKEYEKNKNVDLTISAARPPIFWKEKNIVKEQIQKWNLKDLKKLMYEINKIELEIKKNISNSLNLINDFILEISNYKTSNKI